MPKNLQFLTDFQTSGMTEYPTAVQLTTPEMHIAVTLHTLKIGQ